MNDAYSPVTGRRSAVRVQEALRLEVQRSDPAVERLSRDEAKLLADVCAEHGHACADRGRVDEQAEFVEQAACDQRRDLRYDHVIPVARGAATSLDNLQLLSGVTTLWRRHSSSALGAGSGPGTVPTRR